MDVFGFIAQNSIVVGLLFLTGTVLGSFFNVLIYRLPRNIFWKYRRSRCPHCETIIPFYLNVPIVSFFLLRGKSKCCQKKLSWQYPLVELAGGVLIVCSYIHFPFLTIDEHIVLHKNELMRFAHSFIFCSMLLVGSIIDFYHHIVPDEITLTMVALTPLVVYLHPELDWQSAAIGVIAGGGIIYIIAWSYYLIRKKEGMGMGDAKLLAGIGGWLGYQAVFPILVYASVLGTTTSLVFIIVNRKRYNFQTEIPFVPFLAIGAVIHSMWGQELLMMLNLR